MSRSTTLAPQPGLYPAALKASVAKLDPRQLKSNPVIFVTAIVAAMTTVLALRDLAGGVAGAGVALHAKPVVQAECALRINHGDLTALLYLQGYDRDAFVC